MFSRLVLAATLGFTVVTFQNPAVRAQGAATEAELRRLVPYSSMLREFPSLTLDQYNRIIREVAKQSQPSPSPSAPAAPSYRPPSYNWPTMATPPSGRPSSGTSYDWQSGNSYMWRRDSRGNTDVSGFNLSTGSMWQTKIQPDGSMSGFDKGMNYWTYDDRTKTYMNLGTGKICIGEGAARVCTP